MKTINQSGFHRIPKNPKQRNFGEGGTKSTRTVLETFNEESGRFLHPTKGWRNFSLKSDRAKLLVQHILRGGSAELGFMRKFLNGDV